VDLTHYDRHVKLVGCMLNVAHLNFLGSMHNTSRQITKLAKRLQFIKVIFNWTRA
jgi:hypothetical protein